MFSLQVPMETDVALPLAAGLGLIGLIVIGSVVLVLRPSDTHNRQG
ncbi:MULTISPECIES: hypothetical protein [Aphanothece]